jgi:hypothetical protein
MKSRTQIAILALALLNWTPACAEQIAVDEFASTFNRIASRMSVGDRAIKVNCVSRKAYACTFQVGRINLAVLGDKPAQLANTVLIREIKSEALATETTRNYLVKIASISLAALGSERTEVVDAAVQEFFEHGNAFVERGLATALIVSLKPGEVELSLFFNVRR